VVSMSMKEPVLVVGVGVGKSMEAPVLVVGVGVGKCIGSPARGGPALTNTSNQHQHRLGGVG